MSRWRRWLKWLNPSEWRKWPNNFYALMGLTAAIGVVSGIGATCTTFFEPWWELSSFKPIKYNQLVFVLCYFVTWLVAIAWIVLGWALRARKSWFYPVALITSIAGFFSGIIPVWILFYEYWATYGEQGMPFTPSWARAIANLILFVLLVLPRTRNKLNTHMSETSSSGGEGLGSKVANASLVLIGFGLLMMIQPFIMPMTHQFEADVYMYIGRQFEAYVFYTGAISLVFGVLLQLTGRILNYFYTPITSVVKH